MKNFRLNCRFFVGDKPCKYDRLCRGCKKYEPLDKKILIIKLSALGDVLRTTPILTGLKRKYPHSYICWVTEGAESIDILKNNPYVDRIFNFDSKSVVRLEIEKFDLVLSLDKAPQAAALAMKIASKEKIGFGFSEEGSIYPLNKESEYSFLLGLSNDLKFKKNKLTYQEQTFQMCRLEYRNDEYILNLSKKDLGYAVNILNRLGISRNKPIIGLNTGAGKRFSNKAWIQDKYIELIYRIKRELNADILLLGGPEELERNQEIVSRVKGLIYDTGCNNPISGFAGIIHLCDLIVTGDTTAMHIAIALKKKVVALFGPTCAQEIDLYGRGIKIVSDLNCSPCYKENCHIQDNCMQKISVDEVFNAIKKLL
jgi:heptosyltransferase-2